MGVLVGKNMIPLLIANSLVGIVLFNSFTHTAALLKRLDGNSNLNLTEENTSSSSIHHPFTAGFVAGSAQALLSVPLSNLQRVIQPELLMLEKRQEGMLKVAWITLKTLLVPSSSSGVEEVIAHGRSTKHHGKYYKHITRFLYRDFAFNIAKDSIGFMLFFGVFETCRDFGKGLVKRTFDLKIAPPEATYSLYNPPLPILQQSSSSSNSVSFSSYSSSSSSSNSSFISKLPLALCNSAAVLASGAMAGLAYQSFSYPMDLIHAAIIHSKTIPTSSSSVTSTSAANLITAATHRDHHPLRHHHKHHDSSIRWSDVRNVIKEHGGIRPFFTGMQSHVLRAMPPSAIALFIYEVASHY